MKLGIFLPSFGYNQDAITAITHLNTMLTNGTDLCPALFYKRIDHFRIKPKTIATSYDRLYQYDGHLITTNLDATYIALQCSRLKSIDLYLSELEWTFNIGNYTSNISVYKSNRINVIAPSLDYANAFENYCGRKVTDIIPGFNINEIATRIRTRNS